VTVRAELQAVEVILGGKRVLDQVSLTVEPGSFVTLLGPSGSGKTTTLNVLAGFVRQSSGNVTFNGEIVDDLPVHLRDIGFVFQNYALFPHMTVEQNVAFSLQARRIKKTAALQQVRAILELVRMEELAHRSIKSLSGGQQQRVALARALVYEPSLLLLDEPLAALDKQLRDGMQIEIKRIQREIGVTAIAVTHDQTEALTMSDYVAIINAGRIEQVGAPDEVYRRPATVFVAKFLGEANLFPVDGHGEIAAMRLRLPSSYRGTAVIRPENLGLAELGARGDGQMEGTIEEVIFQGSRYRLLIRSNGDPELRLTLALPPDSLPSMFPVGRSVTVVVNAQSIHVVANTATSSVSNQEALGSSIK
jgi:putative spermidine/putrescine transport system ATP-binding protein